jgi:hypothetical protein
MEMTDQRTPEEAHSSAALGYIRTNVIPGEKTDIGCLMPYPGHSGLPADSDNRP